MGYYWKKTIDHDTESEIELLNLELAFNQDDYESQYIRIGVLENDSVPGKEGNPGTLSFQIVRFKKMGIVKEKHCAWNESCSLHITREEAGIVIRGLQDAVKRMDALNKEKTDAPQRRETSCVSP